MPPSVRVPVAVAVTFVMSVACVPPAARDQLAEEGPGGLQPTFEATTPAAEPTGPVPETPRPTTGPSTIPSDPSERDAATTGASPRPPTEAATAPSAPVVRRAELVDPVGDVDEPVLVDAPDYADLASASIEVGDGAVTLSVSFSGRTPERSDDDHTMNVASFYDVDGNGSIDFEVWANLSSSGWGTSWFDNRDGRALFGADDEAEASVTPDALTLHFPHEYLGDAGSFRWALAAEWGTYEALATNQMTSDRAPDEGRPADFPDRR